MANLLYIVRYFRVVPPIPRLMGGAFAVLTVVAAVMTMIDPRDGGAAVMPVVVLQAFGASAGFAVPARRGYFDLLLARGEPRVRIAIVHWITAVTPGLVSWGSLALLRAVLGGATPNPVLASGTVTAMLVVSSVPWAVTVALPRFSGAIGWLLVVAVGSVMHPIAWPDWVRGVLYPLSLIGRDIRAQPDVIIMAMALPIVTMGGALGWVHRADIPLVSAQ